ncbi:Thermostable hemolysin [Marinobacter antarcticus]|uniref:Thermostable hemolysin n=1 Tax=Marinobacter antarcticus TaxID=564117 RepID=A0A1M6PM02_9GAMM|nr:thermostable hemolysin [Marinobacter antarcticus]SHK08978.1 Thermostable hemolysin [Marinobacter antarcticus]
MTDPMTMSIHCPPDSRELVPAIRCAGRWLIEIHPNTELAATVAGFIRRRFFQAYGAEPSLRIPSLLALTSAKGTLLAAVGVRNAALEPLFLEDYLSVPVEGAMPVSGIERHKIAEIAHLAGVEAGVSRYLFASLSVWLEGAGYEWVVCTGTGQLNNSFHRMGIATRVLANADPARLPDGGAGWGRYYDHHPVVMAIKVADSLTALRQAGILRLIQPALPGEGSDGLEQGGAYGCLA